MTDKHQYRFLIWRWGQHYLLVTVSATVIPMTYLNAGLCKEYPGNDKSCGVVIIPSSTVYSSHRYATSIALYTLITIWSIYLCCNGWSTLVIQFLSKHLEIYWYLEGTEDEHLLQFSAFCSNVLICISWVLTSSADQTKKRLLLQNTNQGRCLAKGNEILNNFSQKRRDWYSLEK